MITNCPKCKKKLVKNGIRKGKQRFRCSNPKCNYSLTVNKKTPQKQKDAFEYLYNIISKIQQRSLKTYQELPDIFHKIKLQKRDIKLTINDTSKISKIDKQSCIVIAEENAIHIIQLCKYKK